MQSHPFNSTGEKSCPYLSCPVLLTCQQLLVFAPMKTVLILIKAKTMFFNKP